MAAGPLAGEQPGACRVGAGVEVRAAAEEFPHQGVEWRRDDCEASAEADAGGTAVSHHITKPQRSDLVERLGEQCEP